MTSNQDQLQVIALISGGKDSFFSILHCLRNGHRVVALANLFPAPEPHGPSTESRDEARRTQVIEPDGHAHLIGADGGNAPAEGTTSDAGPDTDLNSFMYQTVGHQVIPLYADATGLPLYRQPILGDARDEGRDYDAHRVVKGADADEGIDEEEDETESMVPLLQEIKARHPGANALCAGAILSTYQRTRVESVALRLGLTPLAYLWKYPVLPPVGPGVPVDEAQLLLDMAAAGLDARIVKVASAGLDEDFLWERATCPRGVAKVKKALRRFGLAEGSVLGEGGEFETIVVDGPRSLFRKKIAVPDDAKQVVREGGGTSWLSLQTASTEGKAVDEADKDDTEVGVRVPGSLDPRFESVATSLSAQDISSEGQPSPFSSSPSTTHVLSSGTRLRLASGARRPTGELHWTVSAQSSSTSTAEQETGVLVEKIQALLKGFVAPSSALPTTAIVNTVIVLRRMSDFPAVNAVYGSLFRHPNPPSRVTISCGDLLPDDCNVVIHLTVRTDILSSDRKGLHVQSRSYWAPANIGPYSQAIDVPLFPREHAGTDGESSLAASASDARSVSIAGQIPLWPATMAIPSEADVAAQIVMSLQHLWRIGADQKVQLWSSAVAYFPRAPSVDEMRRKAGLAARAWACAHTFGSVDDDEEEDEEDLDAGPDLWDRKYNSQFMTFDHGGENAREVVLPDWSVMKAPPCSSSSLGGVMEEDKTTPKKAGPPPFFAVEVEELPRQSGVEWHAHTGLSHLEPSTVEVLDVSSPTNIDPEGNPFAYRVSHLVVSGAVARSVVWLEAPVAGEGTVELGALSLEAVTAAAQRAYVTSFDDSREAPSVDATPYLTYLSSSQAGSAAPSSAVVPCRSIWSTEGKELCAIALFGCFW